MTLNLKIANERKDMLYFDKGFYLSNFSDLLLWLEMCFS